VNKKFTILTAVYNSSRYLNDWADSIIAQSYRPLELICVDDQSDDGGSEILKDLSKKIKKEGIDFKSFRCDKKLYCGSSYNMALKYATGNYFGVLDSDDMLEPHAIEFIVDIYEKNKKVAWIYTNYDKYTRRMDRIIKRGFCRHPGEYETILQMESNGINGYGHWRTFSDRLVNKNNLFGSGVKCCVDKHLGFRLEEEGVGMFVDRVCYKYRTRPSKDKTIVSKYPLRKIKAEVINKAKKRRKKSKVYSILRYSG